VRVGSEGVANRIQDRRIHDGRDEREREREREERPDHPRPSPADRLSLLECRASDAPCTPLGADLVRRAQQQQSSSQLAVTHR